MINYIDKGEGLSNYLASFGIELAEVYDGNSVRWESNKPDEIVNEKIDEYNPWPFERNKKLIEINEWLELESAKLVELVPTVEQKNWPIQVNEAFGLMPLNLLISLANERGITTEELVDRVKQNHWEYCGAYGRLQGKRDRIKQLVNAFTDNTDITRLPELWTLKCTA